MLLILDRIKSRPRPRHRFETRRIRASRRNNRALQRPQLVDDRKKQIRFQVVFERCWGLVRFRELRDFLGDITIQLQSSLVMRTARQLVLQPPQLTPITQPRKIVVNVYPQDCVKVVLEGFTEVIPKI